MYSTQKYGRFEVCNKGIGSDSDHSTMKQWDSIGNSLSATQFIIWGWDGQEVWTTTVQFLCTYLHPPLIHRHQTYLLLAGGQTWEPSRQGSVAGETDVQTTEASGSGRWITSVQLFLFNDQITHFNRLHPLTQTCVGLTMTDCSEDKVWTFDEEKFLNALPTQWL